MGKLVSIESDGRLVWLDIGDTVRVVGDGRDSGDLLFLEVVAVIEPA